MRITLNKTLRFIQARQDSIWTNYWVHEHWIVHDGFELSECLQLGGIHWVPGRLDLQPIVNSSYFCSHSTFNNKFLTWDIQARKAPETQPSNLEMKIKRTTMKQILFFSIVLVSLAFVHEDIIFRFVCTLSVSLQRIDSRLSAHCADWIQQVYRRSRDLSTNLISILFTVTVPGERVRWMSW